MLHTNLSSVAQAYLPNISLLPFHLLTQHIKRNHHYLHSHMDINSSPTSNHQIGARPTRLLRPLCTISHTLNLSLSLRQHPTGNRIILASQPSHKLLLLLCTPLNIRASMATPTP